jgi:hypothetical protein
MTIFRSDLIDPDKLEYQLVSANDPDIIGVEVRLDGNVLLDVSMNPEGLTSVLFDQDRGSMEFDLSGLRHVLDKCERELAEWRGKLIVPGEIWDPNQ